MKWISNIAYTFFFLLLIGIAALFLAPLLPIPGNIDIKIVRSGSMEPAIETGALVVVKPEENYSVGDIVTFGQDTARSIPTTHRIIAIEGEGENISYVTKGDANEENDPETTSEDVVIGRVWFDIPYAGFVLDFARQPLGFVLLIVVPAAVIVLDESWRIVKELRGRRKKKKESNAIEKPVHDFNKSNIE